MRSIGSERNFEPPTHNPLGGKSRQGHLMAVVGHLCLSTEGKPSLRRGPSPCHLFIPYTHFSAARVLNWFFLHTAIYFCLSVYLPPLPSSLFFTHHSLTSFISFCHPPTPYLCTPPFPPRQSSALSITQKEPLRNTGTSFSLHLVTQVNKSRWHLS